MTGNLLLGGAVNNYFKPSTSSPWTTHITLEKNYGDLSCVCQSENYCLSENYMPSTTKGNEQPLSNTMKSYMPAPYKHYNKQ